MGEKTEARRINKPRLRGAPVAYPVHFPRQTPPRLSASFHLIFPRPFSLPSPSPFPPFSCESARVGSSSPEFAWIRLNGRLISRPIHPRFSSFARFSRGLNTFCLGKHAQTRYSLSERIAFDPTNDRLSPRWRKYPTLNAGRTGSIETTDRAR